MPMIVVGADTYVFDGATGFRSDWGPLPDDGRRIRLTRNGELVAELSLAEGVFSFTYDVYRMIDGL